MRSKVYLDMDGVLVDFLGGAAKAHNRELPYHLPEAKGIWNTEKLWKITPEEFWAPLEFCGFWTSLKKTPLADDLVELIEDYFGRENIDILTAPSQSKFCIPEKREWMRRYFPQFENRMIFDWKKGKYASPSSYLFDDRDKNILEFEEAGGIGIIVPQEWNSLWQKASRPITSIIKQLNLGERM